MYTYVNTLYSVNKELNWIDDDDGDDDDDDNKDGSLCFNDERQKEFYNGMKKPNIKHRLCSNYIYTGNIFIVICKTLKVQVLTP